MIAAIYARKSTEQAGVSDEERSVTRQIAHARQYAERKGWTVAEEHIYSDEGISGAEFDRRPGFIRLMAALKPRAPFNALVMSEESRLGREQIAVAYALKQLSQAGVVVWLYLEDRERKMDTPTEKLLLSVSTFADEMERQKASQRTADAMRRKAEAGHVTGGRTFGYDNVDVLANAPGADGRRKRLHVERRINEDEAAVVRRIFQLCADGKGVRAIAIALNDAGALAPHPRRIGRSRSWAPSSIREVLYRPLYRGIVEWNKTKKRDAWGQKKYLGRPEADWLRLEAPALRIVDDALWSRAHARLSAFRAAYVRTNGGKLLGRPSAGVESKYLLTGFATCGQCGGGIMIRTRDWKRIRRPYYLCANYHHRGTSICKNGLEILMDTADRAVLDTLSEDLLQPEVIERAITRAVALVRSDPAEAESERRALTDELATVEREIERLTAAVVAGGELAPLVEALKAREQRRDALQGRIAGLDSRLRAGDIDAHRLADKARGRLREWRAVLGEQPVKARQIVGKLLDGRLTFTPGEDERGRLYRFEGRGALGRLLAGVLSPRDLPLSVVTPAGFEPAISTLKGSRPGPG